MIAVVTVMRLVPVDAVLDRPAISSASAGAVPASLTSESAILLRSQVSISCRELWTTRSAMSVASAPDGAPRA